MLRSKRIVAGIERARGIFANKKVKAVFGKDTSNIIFGTRLICHMIREASKRRNSLLQRFVFRLRKQLPTVWTGKRIAE